MRKNFMRQSAAGESICNRARAFYNAAMKLRFFVFLAVGLLNSAASADEDQSEQPGFFSRVIHAIHLPEKPDWLHMPQAPEWLHWPHFGGGKSESGHSKKLALEMQLDPQPLKLSEARQIHVTVVLRNKSKKFVGLEFPTTQRIEVLIRDKAGRVITKWSDDRTFENEPSYVSLNPDERLEYSALLATREMHEGESYLVESFFPNFDSLKVRKSVVPQK
jgi:hypothetical protein